MLELYNALTNPQKHTIRRKYMALFGCKRTFNRKINGEVRLLRAEIIFFMSHNLIKEPEPIKSESAPETVVKTESVLH
jgi:hypothetical protein